MAMQRARPIRMTPVMYSGWSRRKMTARANISTGPSTQFWNRDSSSTRLSAKTPDSSSYFTRASGGYIIRIRPMAMGMLVVPTDMPSIQSGSPGTTAPSSTPIAIATKIHTVSQRSRKDRRRFGCSAFTASTISGPSGPRRR